MTRLKFHRQVRLKITEMAPTNYEPLVVIKGQQMSGWPEKPDHEQFDYDNETIEKYKRAVKGEDKETYVNFESIWSNWEHGDEAFATVGMGRAIRHTPRSVITTM